MLKKYTLKQKLDIAREARGSSIYAASKKYGIDRKRIREWIEQEEKLEDEDPAAFRISGGGRKPCATEIEEMLCARIEDWRLQKLRVSRAMIQMWAVELGTGGDVGINFSDGWLQRFFDRHSFVLRRATNKPTLSDAVIVDRAARFIVHIKQLIRDYDVSCENIFCLDETALFFDHNDYRTIDKRGVCHVPVFLLC
jgi:hypothetical protein